MNTILRNVDSRSRRKKRSCAINLLASLLLMCAASASGAEHPGAVPRDAECSACHANKVRGKSVHSAMATTCTVCHVTKTQGDMTTVSLSMPKERICSACHDETAALLQHVPGVQGSCVECHDAHSSDR